MGGHDEVRKAWPTPIHAVYVKLAVELAEKGCPITQQKRLDAARVAELAERLGYTVDESLVKKQLSTA